jgi:hypothetical protein
MKKRKSMFIKFVIVNTPTQDRTILIDAETIHRVEFYERTKGDGKEHAVEIFQRKEGYVRYTLKDADQAKAIEDQLRQYANLRACLKQTPAPQYPASPFGPVPSEPLTPLIPPWQPCHPDYQPWQPFVYTVSDTTGNTGPILSGSPIVGEGSVSFTLNSNDFPSK